ncbi:sugar transferase [Pigmentiphaga litoralis]|jgi:putative colanic acid biosynthesis UDP-glucose lipid carrier transferase|uniref:undecaprenyl-phosphate glucose phosphotransferase n=1 Tax=Pigmentiphaga litoralis TaxID=516702 RepID=UPI0019919656|nr:undecaprenyl-phosphate glucose phosphotransferase [Pigmentiphaga litoralis]GGX23239.1 sugar transferase [Pigmentiphaga litoralis]
MAQDRELVVDAASAPTGFHGLRRLADFMLVAATGWLSAALLANQPGQIPVVHLFVLCLCSMGVLALFPLFALYGSSRRRCASDILRCASAWLLVLSLGVVLATMIDASRPVSSLWAGTWLVSAATGMIGMRLALHYTRRAARQKDNSPTRIVIFGFGDLGSELYRRALQAVDRRYEVVGIYDQTAKELPGSVERVASLDGLRQLVRNKGIKEIWLTKAMQPGASVQDVVLHLRNELVDLRWIPDVQPDHLSRHRVGRFFGHPTVDLNSFPDDGVRGLVKAAFDRVFAAGVLIALSPVLLAIAIAVKMSSPGPVLFRQQRLGIDGKAFHLYKFRSMRPHKEGGVVKQATRKDPRTTKVGAFLRKTSLDELPQFLNVLKGEMSVVGPRPHAMEHNEIYKNIVDCYMMRHRVKPGITGWAQINGLRGATDTVGKMSARVEYDLFYIENWTFWMDLKIILRTAVAGWVGKNAY